MRRRVVVTGLGVASSLGLEVEETWQGLISGRSGIGFLRQFDSRAFPVRIGGEIDLDRLPPLGDELSPSDRRDLEANRTLRFAHHAAQAAVDSTNLDWTSIDRRRAGVSVGAGVFPVMEERLEDWFADRSLTELNTDILPGSGETKHFEIFSKRPGLVSQHDLSSVSTLLSRLFGLRGSSWSVQAACTSGTQAIGEAFRAIRRGSADLMLTGGADSMLSMFCISGFVLLKALSTYSEPAEASRPFDLSRNGFVMSEGAAMLVLEALPHALARGATIYGEVLGYGASCDSFRFTDVHPRGRGAVLAMRRAVADAGKNLDDIDYINAHGTATEQNDAIESLAIRDAFGTHADRLLVSSTKSQLGHLICAAGAIEALIALLTIERGVVPPTINLHQPDPQCDLDFVPLEARRAEIRTAISNSFGFGGQNGTLVFGRWDGPDGTSPEATS